MHNLIVLYEPTCRVYVDDKLHGTFYVDNTYSRANCSLHYDDYELPEGVFNSFATLSFDSCETGMFILSLIYPHRVFSISS